MMFLFVRVMFVFLEDIFRNVLYFLFLINRKIKIMLKIAYFTYL